jgi:hypothetical protein
MVRKHLPILLLLFGISFPAYPIYSSADIDVSGSVVCIANGSDVWSISVSDPGFPVMLDTHRPG